MDVVNEKLQNAEKMSVCNYDITVKYYPETDMAKVPFQSTLESAVYHSYATISTNILPKSHAIVSLDLRWAIPKGFYGKIFSRFGLFVKHLITAEAGVVDSGYRGIVKVLLFNHSEEVFSVKIGDRIAHVVFMEKFDVNFQMVRSREMLDKSVRNEGGFGSTGTN